MYEIMVISCGRNTSDKKFHQLGKVPGTDIVMKKEIWKNGIIKEKKNVGKWNH